MYEIPTQRKIWYCYSFNVQFHIQFNLEGGEDTQLYQSTTILSPVDK